MGFGQGLFPKNTTVKMSEFHQNKEAYQIVQRAISELKSIGEEWVVACYRKSDVKLITLDELMAIVAVIWGLPVERIKSKSRKRDYCDARHCFVYVARELGITKNKCAELEAYMGVDHTTVIHRYDTARGMLETGEILFTRYTNDCIEMAINQSNVPAISNLIRCEQPSI